LLWAITPCQIHGVRDGTIQGSILENLRLFAPNHVLWDGGNVKVVVAGNDCLELHDVVGLRVRKRMQQDGIDDGKNRSIGANAKSQREHGDGGEAFASAQRAEGVTKILP
jgi:hypothetical protein